MPTDLRRFIEKLTGITVGPVGLQWEVTESEREVIRDLLLNLENHRVLFWKGCGSDRVAMISSVSKIREDLVTTLRSLPEHSSTAVPIRGMLDACFAFQSALEELGIQTNGYGGPEEDLFIEIGKFRAITGWYIGYLSEAHAIPIQGNLAAAVPHSIRFAARK